MKPVRLSAQILDEIPPVLAQYLEQERNPWMESIPRLGKIFLREAPGIFVDVQELALEQRLLTESVGPEWGRAIRYRNGFELGRMEAARHFADFKGNARLALQGAPVLRQLQGCFTATAVHFEFDLSARMLYREITLKDSVEALAYREWAKDADQCACCATAGYLAGHISHILGIRAITLETECIVKGGAACRFIGKFDGEWGEEGDWARQALAMRTVQEELLHRDEQVATARRAEQRARTALSDMNRRLRSDLMIESLVAESPCMEPVIRRARQVMASDSPVLVIGEPGSGCETLARAIHFGGPQRTKPFVNVDCLGLTGDLLTQEIFGYEKDGIRGATRPYTGACVRAGTGGTLYLNEIAHLTLEAQVMLLRVMREGAVFPVGASTPVKADVRVIAATQYDLARKVASREFLEHLYYALAVVTLDVPPLRERDSDILRLAESFLRASAEHYNREDLKFSAEFKQALLDCAWPGNLRQLRSAIEHAVIMTSSNLLDIADLPEEVLATRWRHPQEELTEEVVRAALRRAGNNRSEAAELLGIGRTSLWRVMKRLRIE